MCVPCTPILSLFPSKFGLCSPEIYAFFHLFPKTPRRASIEQVDKQMRFWYMYFCICAIASFKSPCGHRLVIRAKSRNLGMNLTLHITSILRVAILVHWDTYVRTFYMYQNLMCWLKYSKHDQTFYNFEH